jgi:hypothetical protein
MRSMCGADAGSLAINYQSLLQAALGKEHGAAMAAAAQAATAQEADLLARHAAAMEQARPSPPHPLYV